MPRRARLTVAVTGMIAGESPAPGVGVIRSLRAHPGFDARVVGLAYDALEAGNFLEGLADDVFLIPYPSQGEEDFLKRIILIRDACGLDVLVPTLDAELIPAINLSDRLKALGIVTFLPTREQFKLRAKDQLPALAKAHGLPVPRSLAAFDAGTAMGCGLGFPLWVKGLYYEAFLARTPHEAAEHFEKLRLKWGLPVILQESMPGEEYNVCALGDGKGGIVGAVPMRKLLLSDKGKAWAGVTVSDRKLLGLARDAVAALRWRGPIELEVMKSGGKYRILEINPRFPAWVYLTQGAGQNLPYACVELALGRRVKPFPPCRSGTMFVRAALDFVVPLRKFERITVQGGVRNS